jgi:hypothetical protein
MKSQWLKDKEAQQLKWNLGALFCLGIVVIIFYVVVQSDIIKADDHLIDGKVLPRNDAQMLNGY